jgi:hypothetical protein
LSKFCNTQNFTEGLGRGVDALNTFNTRLMTVKPPSSYFNSPSSPSGSAGGLPQFPLFQFKPGRYVRSGHASGGGVQVALHYAPRVHATGDGSHVLAQLARHGDEVANLVAYRVQLEKERA